MPFGSGAIMRMCTWQKTGMDIRMDREGVYQEVIHPNDG